MKHFRLFIRLRRDGEEKVVRWRSRWKWRNRLKYMVWMIWWWWRGWTPSQIATDDETVYWRVKVDPAYRKAKCKVKLLKRR